MKFTLALENDAVMEWFPKYLSYRRLKKLIYRVVEADEAQSLLHDGFEEVEGEDTGDSRGEVDVKVPFEKPTLVRQSSLTSIGSYGKKASPNIGFSPQALGIKPEDVATWEQDALTHEQAILYGSFDTSELTPTGRTFFMHLDSEVQKINSFYSAREQEAAKAMQAVALQLASIPDLEWVIEKVGPLEDLHNSNEGQGGFAPGTYAAIKAREMSAGLGKGANAIEWGIRSSIISSNATQLTGEKPAGEDAADISGSGGAGIRQRVNAGGTSRLPGAAALAVASVSQMMDGGETNSATSVQESNQLLEHGALALEAIVQNKGIKQKDHPNIAKLKLEVKQSMQATYRLLELANNFKELNVVAVYKILKKFDKKTGHEMKQDFINAIGHMDFMKSNHCDLLMRW
jgi:hypothetical protein